jgi:hypothetical protein
MILLEGGNVFKDAKGQELTQRINRVDVAPTVKFLEQITGLSLLDNMLGSTGNKETSGDLDLAVDASVITKEALRDALINWCLQQKVPKEQILNNKGSRAGYIMMTGNSVHFRTPIKGNAKNGFVQTDFMFLQDMKYSKWMLSAMPPDSKYKGADRAILLNSIAKTLGTKLNVNSGLHDRMTDELITTDPNKIAQILLNPSANATDLASVESIVSALRNDINRDKKLGDAAANFKARGLALPAMDASVHPTEWFKHLSSKIR